MKKMRTMFTIFLATFSVALTAQDTTNRASVSGLLDHYYGLSEALVAGNSGDAVNHATAFIKVANATDYKLVSEGNIATLVKDATNIAATKDLSKQREYFMNLSRNMTTVAKSVKLSDKPVYEVYCPMKKASWLSSKKDIRNPYYGNSMLTCGQVKSTIE